MSAIAGDFDNILISRIAAMFTAIGFSVAHRTGASIVSAFVVVVIHKNPPLLNEKICVAYDNKQL